VSKTDELRQNGTSGTASDDERHDMSAVSVGDITIDSVKDHLFSTSGSEENRISELKSSASSTLVTTTAATTEQVEQQSVVRTTTVISSTAGGTISNETVSVNSTSHTPNN